MNIKKVMLAVASVLMLFSASVQAASISDYGADGTDTVSDNRAFSYAFSLSNDTVITVPDGTYYVESITIPEGRVLAAEEGANPVIRTTETSADNLITLNTGSVIDGITLINDHSSKKGIVSIYGYDAKINNCTVDNFEEYGVYGDHSDGLVCTGTSVRNSQNGIHTVYASDITVKNCYVKNISNHGIWFWNNDGGQKVGGRIVYDNNVVMDAVGGIWGTGASVVEIRNCTVDNCSDVGIDFEYCDNGIICDNYVSRCKYAGISLFHTCKNITIRDNVVYNNHREPTYQDDCAGIKLMAESDSYDYDTGHDNVRIYNNTVYNAPDSYGRRGIFISTSKINPRKVYVYDNAVVGNGNTAYVNGGLVAFNDFVFECDGSSFTTYEYDDNEEVNLYKLVGEGDASDGTAVVNGDGTGTYRADLELLWPSDVVIKCGDKIIAEIPSSSVVENGGVYSVYFDMSEQTDISFTVDYAWLFKKVSLYKADLEFFKLISVKHGIEYIYNSHYPVYSGFMMKTKNNSVFSLWGDIYSSIRHEIKQ